VEGQSSTLNFAPLTLHCLIDVLGL